MLFATCFNTFGGMKLFFPNMLKWIGRAGIELHTELAKEIRSVIQIQRWETLHGCHGTDAVDEIRCVRRAPDRTPRSVAVWESEEGSADREPRTPFTK
ncbi:hypothetical protein V6N11_017952 [Hibiscus sabdariffa]|uniref:Uncharacterized protein n=1 Tax=Hibiscus sabdariffa TaxID=183260 RepID=A0ABR2T5Y3_9ROSI